MLPKQAIEEFKQITKEEFGKDLSEEEAFKLANNFINLCKKIFKPISNKDEKYKSKKQ